MAIVVLGSINIDLVVRGPRLPLPGETVLGGRYFQAAGGKGANQAVAAARAGVGVVTFIGAVGDDAFGQTAMDSFAKERLDIRFVKTIPDVATGIALILVDDCGQNSISVASGANQELTPDDIDALPNEIFRADNVFLTCLELPLLTVLRGLQRAKSAGMRTILNPAPADRAIMSTDMLRFVDVLTPNEHEAGLLTGISAPNVIDVQQSANVLRDAGCRAVIITRGADGCFVLDEPGQGLHLAAMSVAAIDTTAAGDAFNGALAVGLSEKQSLMSAVRLATVAAGLSVTREGAQPSLPQRDEIEKRCKKIS